MKALITAGGRGTRLSPVTHTKNKHLIPIANKPMIYYALDAVSRAGINQVGIVCAEGNQSIKADLGNGDRFNLEITYIYQKEPLGLAHVIKISESFINRSPFIFYLGDNIFLGDLRPFINSFFQHKSSCHLMLAKVENPMRFGVPQLVDGQIVAIEEKPTQPKSDYAIAGIYIYDSSIFEAVNTISPSSRGELEISDAHQYLLKKKYKLTYSEIKNWWKDTGEIEDLLEANKFMLENMTPVLTLEGFIDSQSKTSGNVFVGRNTVVRNSTIFGPAIIGDNCVIESSFIGSYTSLYHDVSIVQSNIENSILLRGCRIKNVSGSIASSLLGNDVSISRSHKGMVSNCFILGSESSIKLLN